MAFRVGDHVHIIDEEGEGIILEIKRNNEAVVVIDDFEYDFPITSLIKIDTDNNLVHKAHERSFDHLLNDEEQLKVKEVVQHIPKDVFGNMSKRGYPEIDLHIHELVDKPQSLSNSEMVETQVHRLEHFIQTCVEKSISEFVVIHGVGEGVLRTEVRKVLESHGNISFQDADYTEYGYGATYAKMRGLFT